MDPESKFNEVKEKMIDERGFSFNRLAFKTRAEFIKYSEEEFANDFGAAFTYIWKFFKGECSSGHEEINEKIDFLAEAIAKINEKLDITEEEKDKPQEKKRLDGSTAEQRQIKRKKKMEEKKDESI